jgi:hypothetical protein
MSNPSPLYIIASVYALIGAFLAIRSNYPQIKYLFTNKTGVFLVLGEILITSILITVYSVAWPAILIYFRRYDRMADKKIKDYMVEFENDKDPIIRLPPQIVTRRKP